ncbi:MAG TPA: bifunctional phosphoribosylaminoimidazolecarboxamide formyltransferase/IMP cyclohydrolase [Acidimicrobiales bacterium]|nr:bifunctional phosphoribosylaminoimidazolecarboxamide formyltransferase/IMP cyclohydrolase [Acidimicrobiales bacterium]
MRALLSVYDKSGLVELARGLEELGWELVASGGTSEVLAEAGVAHGQVPELTGIPEMLGGRVKTLHPAVHGGILADRSKPEHLADLEAQGIVPIDLVVCNLYPFESRPSVEMIDVGGPTMVRAAAKNHDHVGILVDPSEYTEALGELRASGVLSDVTRRRLARAAFAHTAAYDAAIVAWFDEPQRSEQTAQRSEQTAQRPDKAAQRPEQAAQRSDKAAQRSDDTAFPPSLHLTLELAGELRYGENPHQRGARYRVHGRPTWWDGVVQHGGSRLSYLNLFDTDAAWRLVHELPGEREVAVVIVKHANPCGAAVAADLPEAYRLALDSDPVSAFGGIVAIGGRCTRAVADAVAEGPQADVVVATGWEPAAVEVLASRRRSTRILEGPPYSAPGQERVDYEVRSLGGGYLVQEPDRLGATREVWQVVTKAAPDEAQWRDLELAWRVCARTSSNAIVVAGGGQAVGVGAGQQSRVEAAEIAVRKAGSRAQGAAAASDAFFPFRDGLDVLADAGVRCVVQPGGSVRDAEIVAAADEREIVMVLTGERHFRH